MGIYNYFFGFGRGYDVQIKVFSLLDEFEFLFIIKIDWLLFSFFFFHFFDYSIEMTQKQLFIWDMLFVQVFELQGENFYLHLLVLINIVLKGKNFNAFFL